MIKGSVQTVEHGSSATRLHYITTDNEGREQIPDDLPTIEILDQAAGRIVAPASAVDEFDFDVDGGLAKLDTIIQMASPGDLGWTVQVAAAVAAAVTINRLAKTILIEFVTTVTTVTDIEALITALVGDEARIEIGTAGTGANVLATATDTLAATALIGGVGAAMDRKTPVTEGWLNYDTQTVAYGIGEDLTGGTSTAKGRITDDRQAGAAGRLHLMNVDGEYEDNETATDSGDGPGSAKVNGVLFSCEHFYDLDASSESSYPIGRHYQAVIRYEIDGKAFKRPLFFDVVWFPMANPMVTTTDIDELYPAYVRRRPTQWKDWGPAIRAGHSELVDRINKRDEQADEYVKREQEMYRMEMALIRAQIAESCEFKPEEQERLSKKANAIWSARGVFTISKDDEGKASDETKTVSSRLSK